MVEGTTSNASLMIGFPSSRLKPYQPETKLSNNNIEKKEGGKGKKISLCLSVYVLALTGSAIRVTKQPAKKIMKKN